MALLSIHITSAELVLMVIGVDILTDDLGVGATVVVVLLRIVHPMQLPLSLSTLTGTQTALFTLLIPLILHKLYLF
jgi:hypothetical protein